MSDERYEYRVRWRREGLRRASQIFQTEKGAKAKVERLLKLEQTKEDIYIGNEYEDWRSLPDIVEAPSIERRAVGEWLELVDP